MRALLALIECHYINLLDTSLPPFLSPAVAHTIPLLASILSPGSQVLGPLFVQLAASSLQPSLRSLLGRLRDQSPEVVQQLSPLLEQLAGIYGDILRGGREFVPSPAEARRMVREGYCVGRSLLVQFEADPVDDTEQLVEVLTTGELAGLAEVQRVALPGNHLRPLAPQLARLLPSGWAEAARSQGDALLGQVFDAAAQVGIRGETRGGLERLARAATGFAGAVGEALGAGPWGAESGSTGAAPAQGPADASDLVHECALFMELEIPDEVVDGAE